MLKTRVIPVILVRNGMMVKGSGFDSWRQVGSPLQAARVHDRREVDELVILDIGATPSGAPPDWEQISELADACFMPLTVGGGVCSCDDIRRLLLLGADKAAINTAAVERPALISEAAEKFGRQCVTVSIDVSCANGRPEVVTRCGKMRTGLDPVAWAVNAAERGAGEILLGSVERDGAMCGYDLEMVRAVSSAVDIPVVAVGGCGGADDMVRVIGAGAHAAAAGAVFQFTEATPKAAKQRMLQKGIAVRL